MKVIGVAKRPRSGLFSLLESRPSGWKTWIVGSGLIVILHWGTQLSMQVRPGLVPPMQMLDDKIMWLLTLSLVAAVISWSRAALKSCRTWLSARVKITFTMFLGQAAVEQAKASRTADESSSGQPSPQNVGADGQKR